MPISNTGPIKFSDIQTEFGGSPPISISEYYKNAPSGYTSSVTDMVVIGQPINISKFKGKSAIIYVYNVYSCGDNFYGQLGLSTTTTKYTTLQQVKGVNGSGFITNIVQVSGGGNYSLFLKSDGTVYSCGQNTNGQLGLNNTAQYTTLQQVKGVNGSGFITDIVQVAGGQDHSNFLQKVAQ